jgi:hypothetical protein
MSTRALLVGRTKEVGARSRIARRLRLGGMIRLVTAARRLLTRAAKDRNLAPEVHQAWQRRGYAAPSPPDVKLACLMREGLPNAV